MQDSDEEEEEEGGEEEQPPPRKPELVRSSPSPSHEEQSEPEMTEEEREYQLVCWSCDQNLRAGSPARCSAVFSPKAGGL